MDSSFFSWTHRSTGNLEHDFWESYSFSVSEEGEESWSNALADKEGVLDLTELFPPDECNPQRVFDLDGVAGDLPNWMLEVRTRLSQKWAPAGALRIETVATRTPRWVFFGWDNL